MKEKLKELFKNKEKVISLSYLISLVLGLITLGLFALDIDKSSSTYQNFYTIAFKESQNRMWYLLAALIFFYYILTIIYSLASSLFMKRKDPKVKGTTLKYAKFNEISAIVITEIFAVYILVFLVLTKTLVDDNLSTGISVLVGLMAFLTLTFDGIGDYFEEAITNQRAREIIEQRKIEAENAKIEREKEEKKVETKKENEVKEEIKEPNYTVGKEVKKYTTPNKKKKTTNSKKK